MSFSAALNPEFVSYRQYCEDKASRENFVLIVQFSIVGGTFLDYEEVF